MLQPCVGVWTHVCVRARILLQGAKLLQMSICWVHNPPEPAHMCALHNTRARKHNCTHSHRRLPKPNKAQKRTRLCVHCRAFLVSAPFRPIFVLAAICIKNIPPFLKLSPWCSCNTQCDINITSFLTRIQKCTYTYFTTGVKRSTGGKKRQWWNSPNRQTYK